LLLLAPFGEAKNKFAGSCPPSQGLLAATWRGCLGQQCSQQSASAYRVTARTPLCERSLIAVGLL